MGPEGVCFQLWGCRSIVFLRFFLGQLVGIFVSWMSRASWCVIFGFGRLCVCFFYVRFSLCVVSELLVTF